MGDLHIAAALEEGAAEAWASVHSEIRERLATLSGSGKLGESASDGFREFFRLGYLRGYLRAIEDRNGR